MNITLFYFIIDKFLSLIETVGETVGETVAETVAEEAIDIAQIFLDL